MNSPNPNPTPTPNTPPPVAPDWREQRRAERAAVRQERWQRHGSRRNGWIWGVILILLGMILLLQNMGFQYVTNWWALFILIPAFWAYVGAWDVIQANGRLTRRAASSLTVGILLTILALVFLFNLAFGLLWPVLLIAGGLALVLAGLLPE
jgi:hypothetical protein